jgi:hypothetical protein
VLRLIPCVCMPSPIPRQDQGARSLVLSPWQAAFPEMTAGQLLRYSFRGLLSVPLCYSLHTCRVA